MDPAIYPVNDFGPLMKGLAIGGLGIFHVFTAHFAIGGGMLLTYFQWLALTAAGAALTTVGMTVCREAIRIAALGGERFEGLFPFHEAAMSKSGLVVFLTFFVLNAGLIGLCVWLVRKNTLPEVVPAPAEPKPDDARFEQPG